MSVLLYRYTHKIINALSVRKVFSAVLVRRILNSWLSEAQQQKLTFDKGGKVDSAFCRIALLGFAIRINTLVNIDEGKNQRD